MDIKYLAGFFDGEGSISITRTQGKTGRVNFQLVVKVGNINLAILREFEKQFGGFVGDSRKKVPPRHRRAYYWLASAKTARIFLEEISPYLFIKKQQADLALEYSKQIRPFGGYKFEPLTEKELEYRNSASLKMKKLNGTYKWNHLPN